MQNFFTQQRKLFANQLSHSPLYWKISPLTYANYLGLQKEFPSHVFGKVLDAGAGSLTSKPLLMEFADAYESMDVSRHCDEIDFVGDIQSMDNIPNEKYDIVYSAQVLEHVPRPGDAIRELYRVCKVGGNAIITVPHLSALHEEPHDYYRYTPYSLRFLFESAGFRVVKIHKMGGLLSFTLHPLSMFLVLIFWRVPLLKWLIYWLNFCVLVLPAIYLDRLFGLERKFPANIMAIGCKDHV